ncbi:MAG: hypothetical protein ACREXY_23950, partial [Gammaproteobacteria bacterium]
MHLKKRNAVVMALVGAIAAVSAVAYAEVNVKQEPTIEFSGASATVSGGNFSGLGNIPAFGTLTVTGLAT